MVNSGGLTVDSAQTHLDIYVSSHCPVCQYAYEVADGIRVRFPSVLVRLVDIETTVDTVPEKVFATPTYVLNGRIWSLGNPSDDMIRDAFEDGQEDGSTAGRQTTG